MDSLAIAANTAEACLATDEQGRIIIWNKPAEKLLGHPAAKVLGKPCHDVLGGRDPFGNVFCHAECSVQSMVRRKASVRRFEMDVRHASGRYIRTSVSIVVVPGAKAARFSVIHLLQPLQHAQDVDDIVKRLLATAPTSEPATAATAATGDATARADVGPLTTRELEILRLVADGASTREIADTLFISVATVRTHVQNILRKLSVHSKVEAVSLALRERLI